MAKCADCSDEVDRSGTRCRRCREAWEKRARQGAAEAAAGEGTLDAKIAKQKH